jgi:hypothetical protein
MEYYKRHVGEVNVINGEDSIEIVTGKIRDILIN